MRKRNKKIKITFNKAGDFNKKKFFPFKVLIDNFNVEVVDRPGDADIIYEAVCRDGNYESLHRDGKTIIISTEDLFIKRNIFNLLESFIFRLGFKNMKYKIMDRLDAIIPKSISGFPVIHFLPEYLNFVKNIIAGNKKNGYAVIQNEIHHKNIFILPVFLQEYYYRMSELIKKKNQKVDPDKKFCAFIVSSNSSRERVDFFKKLSKYKKIDSYGKVLNNIKECDIKDWHDNSEIFKNYKFVICFENDFSNEYITEKLPNAMFSGAIPIYRGAPDVGKYFNTKSFINYEDYGSYDKMIEKIIELDRDDKKYVKFLSKPWFKNNKIPDTIKNKEKELIEFYKKLVSS